MKTEEAFAILHQQACDELEAIQSQGAALFEQADFAGAREAADRAEAVKQVIGALEELQAKWQQWISKRAAEPAPKPLKVKKKRRRQSSFERTPHGLLTQRETYRMSILQALTEMGGRARSKDVLDRVGELLGNVLTDLDRGVLRNGRTIRWRNSAEWTRLVMVRERELMANSPRGIWEITQKGREVLQESSQEFFMDLKARRK